MVVILENALINYLNIFLTDLDLVDSLKDRLIKTIQSINFASSEEIASDITTDNTNAQVLEELFKIQDGISEINKRLSSSTSDTSAISLLADKLVDTSKKAKSQDEIMVEFLNSLLSKPDQLNSLIELSKNIPMLK